MVNGYSYTSNDVKLFKHLDNLKKIQSGKPAPIMFHIAATNRCNANCNHCCFADRDKNRELPYGSLLLALDDMRRIGVRAIEHTGGGEPTMYSKFNDFVEYANDLGMRQGINTNGIKIDRSAPFYMFDWIRLSFNVVDCEDENRISEFEDNAEWLKEQAVVSACYIVPSGIGTKNIKRAIEMAERHKIITRIAPDCLQEKDGIKRLIDRARDDVSKTGTEHAFVSDFNMYLGDRKDIGDVCLVHAIKPFLYNDGWIYSCPSSELATENGRDMSEKFRVCKAVDMLKYFLDDIEQLQRGCTYCKYEAQNRILYKLLQETEHNEFT